MLRQCVQGWGKVERSVFHQLLMKLHVDTYARTHARAHSSRRACGLSRCHPPRHRDIFTQIKLAAHACRNKPPMPGVRSSLQPSAHPLRTHTHTYTSRCEALMTNEIFQSIFGLLPRVHKAPMGGRAVPCPLRGFQSGTMPQNAPIRSPEA